MNVGFEYKNKKDETPFETFLRYTDQKEKSAEKLATILRQQLHQGASILDVGAGNGEFLELVLSKIENLQGARLTLVEPSEDLIRQLRTRFKDLLTNGMVDIIHSDLESFSGSKRFDIILMSHLFYHVSRLAWTAQLAKALSLLNQAGALIIVLRDKDDAYDFKMEFKPRLFDESFKALVIDDVLAILPKHEGLKLTKYTALAELKIPLKQNREDAIAIVEFYLNKQWLEIPPNVQKATLEFIERKKSVFKQVDGIAVVQKV